jgi:hypothetical protein
LSWCCKLLGLPRGSSAAGAGPSWVWGALEGCPLARFGGKRPRRWCTNRAYWLLAIVCCLLYISCLCLLPHSRGAREQQVEVRLAVLRPLVQREWLSASQLLCVHLKLKKKHVRLITPMGGGSSVRRGFARAACKMCPLICGPGPRPLPGGPVNKCREWKRQASVQCRYRPGSIAAPTGVVPVESRGRDKPNLTPRCDHGHSGCARPDQLLLSGCSPLNMREAQFTELIIPYPRCTANRSKPTAKLEGENGPGTLLRHPPRGQTALRSDRPSGPRGPPRLCQPGRPLELPVGSPEPLAAVKKSESPPLRQSLQGLECLRGPPGTGLPMIWCLLRTVGVTLLYLSAAGKAWRCSSAILTEL